MSNITLGLFLTALTVFAAIVSHAGPDWWTVIGVACGVGVFSFGLAEYYAKKGLS